MKFVLYNKKFFIKIFGRIFEEKKYFNKNNNGEDNKI